MKSLENKKVCPTEIGYQMISAVFCMIVVLSNILSAKLVKAPYFSHLSIPAGVFLYPLTFLLSDLVTEIFGPRKAKVMIYIAFGVNCLSLGLIQLVLFLPSYEDVSSFHAVFELSRLQMTASLIAYLVGQLIDIYIYSQLKDWSGGSRFLWLRNNGATCASQLVDTIIVNMIYLYGGLGMSLNKIFSIILFSFTYKTFFSLSTTPLFYWSVNFLRKKTTFSLEKLVTLED